MNILQEADKLTSGDRQKAYGHPLEDYRRTAKLWSAILGMEVTALQAQLCMCAVKISRLCNSSEHRDSLVDLAGYARTYEMSLERMAEELNAASENTQCASGSDHTQ